MYPDRTIVPIAIGMFANSGGGIHCITQQQPFLPSELPEVTIRSYTHPTDEPSPMTIATFSWSIEGIPVTDYAYVFDQNPDTVPDPVGVGANITGLTKGTWDPLPDGEWYLHVRAKSYYGWNEDAAHYKISIIASVETDEDQIPDYWEDENGLDKNNPADADLDFDKDGIVNYDEWGRKSDPNSADTDEGGVSDAEEYYINGTDLLDPDDDSPWCYNYDGSWYW